MASALRSLTAKAGIAAALIFAAGVTLAGALSYAVVSRTLDEGQRDVLGANTKLGLEAPLRVSNRMKTYSEIFSRHPEFVTAVRTGDARELERVLVREFKAIEALDPAVATLEVTDAKGVVIQRGHAPASRGDDISALPQVRAALAGTPADGVTVSPRSGEAALDSVRPIRFDDKVIGTVKVGAAFDDDTAAELKRRTNLDVVFLFGGKVTASTVAKGIPFVLPPQAIQAAAAGSATNVDLVVGDTPSRARVVGLPTDVGSNLTIAFVSSLEPVEAAKREFASSLTSKALLALAIVLPLTFFLTRLATRLLLQLAGAMRELASGRLDVVLPGIGRRDEIGEIASAVETFKLVAVQKARAEQEEIRKRNEELEQRVTDRTHELREARDKLEIEVAERTRQASLLNLTHDSIFVRDMDGMISYWNLGSQELYGWTAEVAAGKRSHDLLRTIFPGTLEEITEKLLSTGRWEGDLVQARQDGTRLTVASRWALAVDARGRPAEVLETGNDITERKRAEEDLEAVNKELESFAYSVSHDLRAPLRHMVGFAELLQKQAASILDEKSRRYMTIILDAAKRMGNLIDDLLAFSRVGRAEIQTAPVSLDHILREALNDARQSADSRNIAWKTGTLPSVHGDRAMLRLVMVNLIANAVKFSRTSPRPEIEIGSTDGLDEIVVSVKDNGVGFDMKYVDKLFGVFQRLHRAEEFEGTGIGLATVKRIIHRHGGRVWAEGAVDRGAAFYFAIPKSYGGSHE